ncbi:MAG: dTDP-4-dehydrorhamnose 3,5-epimerase [Alphaproteobacteria bacterium]
MNLEVRQLDIPGLLLLTPKRFGDARGFFSETFNAQSFRNIGIDCVFVQDNHSLSAEPGTVRGLHFQRPPHAQAKLIRVSRGAIFDVAVDIRRGSPTYGKWSGVELSAENWSQLFVPPGFAHGFCTLTPNTEVLYKVDALYAPESDAGILWRDPELAINWPSFAGKQVSAKDADLPRLADITSPFTVT